MEKKTQRRSLYSGDSTSSTTPDEKSSLSIKDLKKAWKNLKEKFGNHFLVEKPVKIILGLNIPRGNAYTALVPSFFLGKVSFSYLDVKVPEPKEKVIMMNLEDYEEHCGEDYDGLVMNIGLLISYREQMENGKK